jgi:hypothetical protein
MLRGPHPFLKDNELTLLGGYGVANGFSGVRAALAYGYQLAGSTWLDLRLDVVDAATGPDHTGPEGAPCSTCATVQTFAAVQAGLKYKLRTEIPIVPYGSVVAGPMFLFHAGADGAIGIGLRASVGARYFLYDWLGFGLELGTFLGGAMVDEAAGLDASLRMVDIGLGADVQF